MTTLEVKQDFPIFDIEPDLAYFDSASTTLLPKAVINATSEFLKNTVASARRGAHHLAVKGGSLVEDVRKLLANYLDTSTSQISFQNSIPSAVVSFVLGMDWKDKKNIIVSLGEEHSVLVTLQRIAQILGLELITIPVDSKGETSPIAIQDMINDKTGLVAVSETTMIGGRNEIDQIASITHDYEAIYLSDIRQSIAFCDNIPTKIGPDVLMFSGNIGLMGPPGIAVQWVEQTTGDAINPGIIGSSSVSKVLANEFELSLQPDKFESGVLNIPGIIGLGAALEYHSMLVAGGMKQHLQYLAKHLLSRLQNIPNLQIYGNPTEKSTIFGINIGNNEDGINCHDIALFLDESNIAVRSGLLCAHPLIVPLSPDGLVQISIHVYNTLEDINRLTNVLQVISTDLL